MATKRDLRRPRVVHRQTFQNSNQVVELTLRTIPKTVFQNLASTALPPPFVRDCALKKEIENVVKEKNNNSSNVGPKNVGKLPTNNVNMKTSSGQVTVEVSRKKSNKKQHDVVPRDTTWAAILHSCSTSTSHSESDIPMHSTIDYDSSEPIINVASEKSPILNNRNSVEAESLCSGSKKNQHRTDKISHQQNRAVQTSVLNPTQAHNTTSTRECSHEIRNLPEKLGTRVSSRKRNDTEDPQMDKSKNENVESQKNNSIFQVQSGDGGVNEKGRLLSDDVNASPFGESALQLLMQLRERLRSKGDSEDTDLVGIIEAFIGGQGSVGGVGASNSQLLMPSVSPLYPPGFLTSTDPNNHPHFTPNNPPQYHKNESVRNRGPPNLYGECQQNIKFQSDVEVAPVSPKEQRKKEYMQQDLLDEQQSGNENPQQTPDQPTNQRKYPCQNNLQLLGNEHNQIQASDHHTKNNHNQIPQEINDNINLLREITKQKEIMADQERIITELRKLSAQLIAQQEQIASKNLQQDEVGTFRCNHCIDAHRPNVDGDSGVGIESREKSSESLQLNKDAQSGEREKDDLSIKDTEAKERNTDVLNQIEQEYRSMLLLLKTENETLRREVNSQRELVVNLEIQLTKAKYLLELEQQSRFGLRVSKFSGSAPNLELSGHQKRTMSGDKSSCTEPSSNCGESETDSAYEEKTGSHLTSKLSSPHLDQQKGQDCNLGPAGVSSVQPQQNEENRQPKVVDVDDIFTDSALLQTSFFNREFKSSVTIPSSQLISQQPICEIQEIPKEIRSSVIDQSPEALILSNPENFLTNSGRKVTETTRTQKAHLAKTKGILNEVGVRVSDLNPKPWVHLEYPTDTSFSSVSNHTQDGTVTNETSFLEGINAPRHSRNLSFQKSKIDSAEGEGACNFVIGLHPPLESTRVQESSELQVGIEDDKNIPFVLKNVNTSFESVDELE